VLKVAVIVLVALLVLLGLPLGMPMAGTSMCPDCNALGTWSAMCIALLASVVLFVPRRATRILIDRPGRAVLMPVDVLERPPRLSS
jgi:hypothetical protein